MQRKAAQETKKDVADVNKGTGSCNTSDDEELNSKTLAVEVKGSKPHKVINLSGIYSPADHPTPGVSTTAAMSPKRLSYAAVEIRRRPKAPPLARHNKMNKKVGSCILLVMINILRADK